jgi:hypothetical protein
MKILEYTSTKLTIQQNAPARHWIIGVIFILVGLVAIAGPEQLTTFKCDRLNMKQGSCELVHSSLIKSDVKTFSLESIQEAKLETNPNSQEQASRLILVTKTEQIPIISEYSSNFERQTNAMQQINNFLITSTQPSLEIVEDSRIFSYFFGSLFIIAGLVGSGLMTQQCTCNFDKTVGAITLTRKGLLWKRSQKRTTSEIFGLHVETNKKQSDKKKYRLSLVLNSGQKLNLGQQYELSRLETQKLIDCITTFLNVGVTNMW